MALRAAVSFLLLAACAGTGASVETAGATRLVGATMGTTFGVEVVGTDLEPAFLRAGVERVLRSVDERMSTWDPSSELSRFNASRSTEPFPVSEDTLAVVVAALQIGRLTGGAFDPTVGPLVELWGFGPSGPRAEAPAPREVEEARARVGLAHLLVDGPPPVLLKVRSDLELDLSALAKGFAVDAVARWLDEQGLERYLIEVGGEVFARGRSADGEPWRVAIEAVPGAPETGRVLAIDGRGVATSGDYRRHVEADGRRYTHVLDPRTGSPIESAVVSATVVASTAMRADALATAVMVLGPRDSMRLAELEELAIRLVTHDDGAFREHVSPAFARLRASRPGATRPASAARSPRSTIP